MISERLKTEEPAVKLLFWRTPALFFPGIFPFGVWVQTFCLDGSRSCRHGNHQVRHLIKCVCCSSDDVFKNALFVFWLQSSPSSSVFLHTDCSTVTVTVCNVTKHIYSSSWTWIMTVSVCVLISEGEEGYPDDNINDIFLPLRYQTDVLFTR